MSALTRMAMSDHRKVGIVPGDTIIISATPIPGNEKLVSKTIDNLLKLGANISFMAAPEGIHVSGHASQEESSSSCITWFVLNSSFRCMASIVILSSMPNWQRTLECRRKIFFISENGQILEFTRDKGVVAGKVTSGRVLVDGLGVGDVGNIVLRDRRQLSQDGILIIVVTMNKATGQVVAGPDIVSRGFVYVRESEALMDEARDRVRQALEKCEDRLRNGPQSSRMYVMHSALSF